MTLNTIAHTVGALGVGHETEAAFGDGDYVIAVSASLLTIAILLLSEILPKTIGALYWRKLTVSSNNFEKNFNVYIIANSISN